jgi:hypothetical protein
MVSLLAATSVSAVVRRCKMPSTENKLLQASISPLLKRHGFKKTGATWRRTIDEVIAVINIQGSQWSRTFYLNLGVYYLQIGDKLQPCEFDCHVRTRLENLTDNRTRLIEVLDFENDIPNEARLLEITGQMESQALPWFAKMSDLVCARELIVAQPGNAWWVTLDAKKLLGIPEATNKAIHRSRGSGVS